MSENPEENTNPPENERPHVPMHRKLFRPEPGCAPSSVWSRDRQERADERVAEMREIRKLKALNKAFDERHSYVEPKQLPLGLETPEQPEWTGHGVADSWFEGETARREGRDLIKGDKLGGPNYRG